MYLMKFLQNSSFLECAVFVAVPDRYDFEFSIKTAERKRYTEESTHIQEVEIINNRKVRKSFQSYLGIQKWRETYCHTF